MIKSMVFANMDLLNRWYKENPKVKVLNLETTMDCKYKLFYVEAVSK